MGTALFYVENALFYVVSFSNVLLLFVNYFDNVQIKLCSLLVTYMSAI